MIIKAERLLGSVWPLAGLVGVAPMLIFSSGCGPGGVKDEGFRVESIAFDGDSTITLTFTQPIANPGEVDPNDFRISVGRTMRTVYQYEGMVYDYAYTDYVDVSYFEYEGPYERFAFASATLGAPDQLVLRTETPLGTTACEQIEYYNDYVEMYQEMSMYGAIFFDMAMFVHYAAGEVPVASVDDEPLVDIGRDWVLTDELYAYNYSFGFPKLDPQLRIPCP